MTQLSAFGLPLLALVLIRCLSVPSSPEKAAHVNAHEPTRSSGQQPRKPLHARARITVHDFDTKPYDQTEEPQLLEVHLSETFVGDIDGESLVHALEVLRQDHSSCLVSIQRIHGKLGDRKGSFVLQGSETVENGNIKAKWVVVPGTGTGELSGLRGNGGFEGYFGKQSEGILDYWFE